MRTLVCFEIYAHKWDYRPKKTSKYDGQQKSPHTCRSLLPTSSPTHSLFPGFSFFWNQHNYFVSSCCCIPHNSSRWLLSDKTPLHLRSPHQLGDICAVSGLELWYMQLLWSLLYKLFCGYVFRSVLGKYLGMGGLPQVAALTHYVLISRSFPNIFFLV